MGYRFDLGSASVVAYLTSHQQVEPRLSFATIEGFLYSLIQDHDSARPRLISTSPDWVHAIRERAESALAILRGCDIHDWGELIPPETAKQILEPLAPGFGAYDLYILPVGVWRQADTLDRFAHEAARIPGHGILVLIPDFYNADQNLRVLDPSDGVADALKNRDLWPGAVFLLRSGESRFYPIDEAHGKLAQLAEVFAEYGRPERSDTRLKAARDVLSAPSRQTAAGDRPRILHLSDLHLGTKRTQDTQDYLHATLARRVSSVSHTVITGDLFDQPRRRHAKLFRSFQTQLTILRGDKPIVVPGNHDQRIFGNSFLGIGRRLRQLVDLEWRAMVVDDENKMLFFCFDSARTEDLARGRVDTEQLLRMGTEYESRNVNGRYDHHLKVALVHHHPYPYMPEKEVSIVDPRSWPGRETFVALKGADQFLGWCAGRGVSLILHGHKHIPRLVTDWVSDGSSPSLITTVGCGASLGANGRRISFNVVDWHPDSGSWSVDFQIDRGDGQGFRSAAVETQGSGVT
jgi:3',5'-cyclic AMP phosphodiesterase CpdA